MSSSGGKNLAVDQRMLKAVRDSVLFAGKSGNENRKPRNMVGYENTSITLDKSAFKNPGYV